MSFLKDYDLKKASLNTGLFRKTYLMILSFEMIAYIYVLGIVCKALVLIWGLFILIHNFFIQKLAFKVRYYKILWAFLILMTMTSIVHMSIWFVPNLAYTAYTAVCFFVFYGMYLETSHEKIEKEMVFILKFFAYFGFIFGVLSLLTLFLKQNFNFLGYNLGIFRNRLIGVYTNSNILAFSMIQSIVGCDILLDDYIQRKFKTTKLDKWKFRLFPIVSCICLFLSDSNAAFVFFIVYFTIKVFCNLFFKCYFQYTLKLFSSILITCGFCLLMMSVSFALRDSCQNFISVFINDVQTHQDSFKRKFEFSNIDIIENRSLIKDPETVNGAQSKEDQSSDLHIGRQDYEVSSGRITLFKQGIEIFKHHPWIGIGRANLTLYGKKYLKGGLINLDLHNGYLTILVSCGIIGFSIFSLFSFLVSMDICRYLFIYVNRDCFGVFCKLFSALVAYCGYCLFEKAIIFDMTFMVGFFWSILGYAMAYIYNVKSLIKTEV